MVSNCGWWDNQAAKSAIEVLLEKVRDREVEALLPVIVEKEKEDRKIIRSLCGWKHESCFRERRDEQKH